MFVRLKHIFIAAIAGSILMGAAGCTPEAETAEPTGATQSESSAPTSAKPTPSPTPKPTPTPVPASSKGPAQNWPVPVMPAVAKEKSEAGLEAFTEYYFELVDYTVLTYDTKPIKEVTERSCYLCAKQLIDPGDRNRGTGNWHVGGRTNLTVNFSKIVKNSGVSGFTFLRDEIQVYLPDGELQMKIPALTKATAGTLHLVFRDGWKVADVEFINPDGK